MCQCLPPEKSTDILDIVYKLAMIAIAGFNGYYAVKVFKFRNTKDQEEKERDRKIQLLKTLVLDHNLKNFYSLFDLIEKELQKLKQPHLSQPDRESIEGTVSGLFILLRQDFYDALVAIDENLYNTIKDIADELQGALSKIIFDSVLNLSYEPNYEEHVSEPLTEKKTEILKNLFAYRG